MNSQENRLQKTLKKLARIEEKLSSIIDSEKLKPPNWFENLNSAIYELMNGEMEKFREIFCALTISEWKPKTKNPIVIDSILKNLKKIKEEIGLEMENNS